MAESRGLASPLASWPRPTALALALAYPKGKSPSPYSESGCCRLQGACSSRGRGSHAPGTGHSIR